ncbi:MAG TPA: hypothetical protein VEL76_41300 [Gemmataceae bacterium]|nr:hypothetical protein [Gemmataceae bacterium]
MAGAIGSVQIQQHRLSPMEADLRIIVEVDEPTGAELRGRVHGPKCPGTETIQLAYPLRPVATSEGAADQFLAARVVIPEPNLWTQETPFVYEAVVELWRNGRQIDSMTHTFGLSLRSD